MANSINIIFDAVDNASAKTQSMIGKIQQGFSALNNVFYAVESAARVAGQAMDETVWVAVNYANQVRSLQMVSGQTAEESSRLIQVLDDFKINIDDLTPAIRKMTSEGLQFNLSTLAALSDEYNALATPLEKNAFLMDKFGRAGLDMAEMMGKGGDAIRAMSEDIDASLIVTQQAVDAARQYEIALDDWNDSVQGLKISIGNDLIPVLVQLMDTISRSTDEVGFFNTGMASIAATNADAVKEMGFFEISMASLVGKVMSYKEPADAAAAATDNIVRAAGEGKDALSEMGAAAIQAGEDVGMAFSNKDRLSFIFDFQAQTDNLDKTKEEIKAKMAAIEEEIRAARASGDQGAIPGLQEDFANLVGELQASEAAFKQWQKQAVFAMIQTKLAADGLTDEEFGQLLNIGQDMGLLDEGVVAQAQGLMDTLSGVDTGSLDKAVSDVQYLISQDGRTIKIYVEQTTTNLSGGSMPTSGAPTTATSGGDTFINYGPQYFYGTTLSGILSEWR